MTDSRCLACAFAVRTCVALILASLMSACGGDSGGDAGSTATRAYPAEVVEKMNRAAGLMGKFEFEQAATAFAVIAQDPKAPAEAALNLAIATLNQSTDGAQDDALVRLRALLKTDPPRDLAVRARYCIALCELYLGRAAEAVPHFVAVAEGRGVDAYAQYFAGQALEQVGEFDKALGWYQRAAERDPMLKSALLGVQRCARRSGDDARAERALAAFEKLSENPRAHNAEFKYTRMGDLGLAVYLDDPARTPYAPKAGGVFERPAPMVIHEGEADRVAWSTDVAQHAATVDIDGDGRLDLMIGRASMRLNAGGALEARPLVLIAQADGSFAAKPEHPLCEVGGSGVNSMLFGDVDGDGRTDAYFCRSNGNTLALQTPDGGFRNATEEWGAAGPQGVCVDGALADVDHDGDLDAVVVYREGPNEILANTGERGFKPIGAQSGFHTEDRAPRSIVVGDFDYDRDADILILNETLPHSLFLNERLWKWSEGSAPGISRAQLDDAATGVGIVELADLPLRRAVFASNAYLRLPSRTEQIEPNRSTELGVADVTGDGHQDILAFGLDRIAMYDEAARLVQSFAVPDNATRTQLAMLDPVRGPHLITLRPGAAPLLWAPGPARGPFVALSFSGRTDPSQSMRSNTSGIGTGYALRVGTEWFGGQTFRPHAGRGQSLAPVAVGTGPFDAADVLEIDWSDGVLQSEVAVPSGAAHALTETQRQISSCPVLFAWNGDELRFVTDMLGVGGVGFLLEPGVYGEPRPRESLVLAPGALVAKTDGTLSIALAEPMEESCMLDGARLLAVDLPAGWDLATDERYAINGPAPTGEIVAWRRAWTCIGNDALAAPDLRASDTGAAHRRFIGLLAREQVVELAFDSPIDAVDDPWLVIDGWIEYPYCQTMFAAWQEGAKFRAPNLEARAADGTWLEILGEWGYPAGMPRRMAMPIPRAALPLGCTALRMRTNMEVYFDSARVVAREPLPISPIAIAPRSARLASPGFAFRTTGPQKQPFYDHARALPLWDCRFQRGRYTEFGDVRALLDRTDGAPVVFGPGEEVAIDFASPEPPSTGTTRRYVLELTGWCKDMDLFTRDGETVEPMPASPADPAAAALLAKTRIRAAGGR